jgi:hypothetical protein
MVAKAMQRDEQFEVDGWRCHFSIFDGLYKTVNPLQGWTRILGTRNQLMIVQKSLCGL